ncbi:hypothetical protein [Desulfonema magnum]|uniref:Uncharacterized protein n=1 Tax=Desulfonema magnum TaxID=45655 RepID=A0A975BJ59_9BACT|nr:hypothetical protein [Desulfonema magnum]QTA86297.1 Uncharacterized protein dnm_023180 [Desulfonema magnum]
MKVIADTSVLNYLTLIDAIRVLPYLFGKIIIQSFSYISMFKFSDPVRTKSLSFLRKQESISERCHASGSSGFLLSQE